MELKNKMAKKQTVLEKSIARHEKERIKKDQQRKKLAEKEKILRAKASEKRKKQAAKEREKNKKTHTVTRTIKTPYGTKKITRVLGDTKKDKKTIKEYSKAVKDYDHYTETTRHARRLQAKLERPESRNIFEVKAIKKAIKVLNDKAKQLKKNIEKATNKIDALTTYKKVVTIDKDYDKNNPATKNLKGTKIIRQYKGFFDTETIATQRTVITVFLYVPAYGVGSGHTDESGYKTIVLAKGMSIADTAYLKYFESGDANIVAVRLEKDI